jgi:hypothetical protein
MGLPGWTFFGVAVSATVIFYGGKILERLVSFLFENLSPGRRDLLVSVIVIVIACIPVPPAWLWQKSRLVHDPTIREGAPPERKRGLILLVSRAESALHAIHYHLNDRGPLESVWLIPSNGREEDRYGAPTFDEARKIETECKKLAHAGGGQVRVEIHETGVSPGDAQDTFDYVNRIFRRGNYKPNEIIADFTGGTKPMTVGMVMACLPHDRELEYVPYNRVTEKMDGPYLFDYEHSAFDLVG